GIALPAALALDLEASGRGAEGRATGRLTGGAGLGVDVGLDLGLDAGGATVAMSGAVLGSELTVSGRKPAAGDWTGEVTLQGAGAAGDGEAAVLITATGVLQGDQLVPQVVLATAAHAGDAGVAAAGRVAVGPAGVTVDQTFALPQATAPVRVQGRVAPGLDLGLGASGCAAGQPRGEVRWLERPDGLAATGELEVPLGPVTVRLGSVGTSRSPQLSVTPHAVPDATLTADLAA